MKAIVDPAVTSVILAVLCAVVLALTSSRSSHKALRLIPIRRDQSRVASRTHSYAEYPTIEAVHKGLSCPTHNPKQILTYPRHRRS